MTEEFVPGDPLTPDPIVFRVPWDKRWDCLTEIRDRHPQHPFACGYHACHVTITPVSGPSEGEMAFAEIRVDYASLSWVVQED